MKRETLLEDSLSHPTYSSELENAPQVKRRQFLQAAGLVGVGLALNPKLVLAQSGDFARWRDTVTNFVYTVCNDGRAQVITAQLARMQTGWRGATRDFHYYYSAPIIFLGAISPEEVVCGNGFEVNRYAFYDARCPCGVAADLNAWEMRRISNANEIKYYDCVLTPHGRRAPVQQHADHANYRRTMKSYELDPDVYVLEAKRVYRGKGRAVYGFQVADKADVESGASKPKRDVLLSSEDI